MLPSRFCNESAIGLGWAGFRVFYNAGGTHRLAMVMVWIEPDPVVTVQVIGFRWRIVGNPARHQ